MLFIIFCDLVHINDLIYKLYPKDTGTAYLVTVALLVLPYLLLNNVYVALACMIAMVLIIIAAFSYYTSVALSRPFFARFFEMAGISVGVAVLSFVVGIAAKALLGVEI